MNRITKAVICAVLVGCRPGIPERLGLCAVAHPVPAGWGCVELRSIVLNFVG